MSATGDETAAYRPVSGLAVAAAVAGALSATALVTPFFWVVPLLAAGLACLGLADTSRPGAEKAGRLAALAGLALAVGFGAQAVSSVTMDRWIAASRARAAAGLWVESLRDGRIDDARSMSQSGAVPGIEKIAERLAGCEGAPVIEAIVAGSDDMPEGWQVRVSFPSCDAGASGYDIHLVPSNVTRQEGTVERWMVVKCTPSAGL